MNNDNIDNNSSTGSSGNKSKFNERLKKIRRDKIRKSVYLDYDDESIIKSAARNILKIVLAMPSIIYSNVKSNNQTIKNTSKNGIDNITNVINEENINERNVGSVSNNLNAQRRIKVNKIRNINVSLLKKKKEMYLEGIRKNNINDKITLSDGNKSLSDGEIKVRKLQKEILDLIKKKLVKNINELEILQSELYILKELKLDDVYLNDCQDNIKEIKKLLSKVKSLKEKYDYLKDNVDFEYMLEYGDDLLIDKILELKELCSREDIRDTVNSYKILNEYKYLYLKIDKLQEETIKYEEYKEQKVNELKQRDIDFYKLKNDIYDLDRTNEQYESFVKEQELFLKNLEGKISQIDSYEKVTYRLKGFNKLLGNSFKYLGLLLVNPLRGVVPGIATQTLITRNLIHNLYNNLEWEESRRMVYDAIDYSMSINSVINSLDDTYSLIDSTLGEIVNLKNNYIKKFGKYENSIYGYSDAIKKINKMENAMLGNKIKLDLMREKMKEKQIQNDNKLKMVKKLNTSSNN